MELLLDTHALIWFAEGNAALSPKAKFLIEDPQNDKYVSMVSFYELAIKIKIGKISLNESLENYFFNTISNGIAVLPLSEKHLFEYNNVPLIPDHKDPFDRVIIATAISQRLSIITVDAQFTNYSKLVNIIW